jgi:hypothetical protein
MSDKNYYPDGFAGTGVTPVEGFSVMPTGSQVESGAGQMISMPMAQYETLMAFKKNHMRLFKDWVDSVRVPLTEEQICEIFNIKNGTLNTNANIFKVIDAVRKVEKVHGIV